MEQIVQFLQGLREEIIDRFERFEPYERFARKGWDHAGGGGGEMSVLRGEVFEKAAVNWSGVRGEAFPMQDGAGSFFATGISLITHMHNPHAPTVHMNLRYIETEKGAWFGGGYDLTPMGFPYEEDIAHFHASAQATLDPFGAHFYPQFSSEAKEYFFIPHRNKERGVGGIFFDHLSPDHFDLWKAVGQGFLNAVVPIYERRVAQPYTRHDKERQIELRGHYVEFNLLYDRGTKFGFLSGGNPEAILCSMPPLVRW